jgi:hypothetical protein
VAVAVCAPFGVVAASVGIAARPYVLLPLTVSLLRRRCGIAPASVFRPQMPALAASLAMGGCVWLLRLALGGVMSDAAALPLLVVCGGVVYVLLVKLTMPDVVAQFVSRLPGRA